MKDPTSKSPLQEAPSEKYQFRDIHKLEWYIFLHVSQNDVAKQTLEFVSRNILEP